MGVDDPRVADAAELDATRATRSLRHGLISLVVLVALVTGLLLAVPGLHGVADQVSEMRPGWLLVGVGLEILSCVGYLVAFLQVFERAPLRFGARVALSELAFGAAVSLGGVGSIAVGAWLLVERGGDPRRVAERSAVLFLLTSAINVITFVLAGLGLFIGILPGPSNPLLSIVPAGVGTAVLAIVLALPKLTERLAADRSPGRIQTLLCETANTIRLTEQVLFRRDWRIIGAIAFPVVRHQPRHGSCRTATDRSATSSARCIAIFRSLSGSYGLPFTPAAPGASPAPRCPRCETRTVASSMSPRAWPSWRCRSRLPTP
jgi:hypothetical protein